MVYFIVSILLVGAAYGLYRYTKRASSTKRLQNVDAHSEIQPSLVRLKNVSVISLEDRVAALQDIGIKLNTGLTVDDLLIHLDRSDFTYSNLIFAYGIEIEEEPWGRFYSDQVWDFDTECIVDNGDYVAIVEHLVRLTGYKNLLEDAKDKIDFGAPTAQLSYRIGTIHRELNIPMRDDWVDGDTVHQMMRDIMAVSDDGRAFYGIDNGQAMILFYISEEQAQRLNALDSELSIVRLDVS
jgi:hypothetical protein